MKNLQLHKKLKKKKQVGKKIKKIVPLEKKVEKAFLKLPKWAREAIREEDRPIAIKMAAHSIQTGLNLDPRTGERYSARQILLRNASDIVKHAGMETKRLIFKEFRQTEPSLYARVNSWLYRRGYSFSKLFYQNAKLRREGAYTYIATLELPQDNAQSTRGRVRVSYSSLEIVFEFDSYGHGEVVSATLDY